jgi:uncharacterized protein
MNTDRYADSRTLDVVDEVECRYLLRWEAVGRIAFVDEHDAPTVHPVNFAFVDDVVVFRTEPGLAQRLYGRPVSFQVDRVDTFRRVGWSVLVRGRAERVERVDPDRPEDSPVEPWAPGDRSASVRIVPTELTGRRLELVHSPVDERGYL